MPQAVRVRRRFGFVVGLVVLLGAVGLACGSAGLLDAPAPGTGRAGLVSAQRTADLTRAALAAVGGRAGGPRVGAERIAGLSPRACPSGRVALTFDDGPSPAVTPGLVATLRRLRAPATFFMVGDRVRESPATARLVARAGFGVGDHTAHHTDLTHQRPAAARADLLSTLRDLRTAGVAPTHLMRPPYGDVDPAVERLVAGLGQTPVLWSVDSRDWTGGTASQIAARVLAHLPAHPSHPLTQVVLQHDGVTNSPASVWAVPRIVTEARRRGYCLTGLDGHGRPGFPTPAAHLVLAGPRVLRVVLDEPSPLPTTVVLHVTGTPARTLRLAPGQSALTVTLGRHVPAVAAAAALSPDTGLRVERPFRVALPPTAA